MRNPILRLLEWILTCLTPQPRGRHRATSPAAHAPTPGCPRLPLYSAPLDGSASPLVRPYLLGTPEAHLERRRQRERRHALYLATLGIDAGPDHIHGVRVPAAAR
ncbi:hypothetical protein FE633_33460 [Streptomyces montanus]|uniref:Uncharacterized protein n=1 Tax=Streptomyces montanus TaxID=2580423 RepID=A0A5R9FQZ9_9ACTN|nr:hypothetical protein FE633_33460 [Streptomyces montanus]